eukprot:TRINITY_DN11744_c0_g1_i1.p1 TRINITY_DN11744_c0_g1~~TRINITY_DN11744_c0_g1_i1.p1  ORF type:complete len:305 (-),score=79.85 TRINITY_DN11744_c0_g1_i1:15-929(-)
MLGTLYSSFEETQKLERSARQAELADSKGKEPKKKRAGKDAKLRDDGLPEWRTDKKFVEPHSEKQLALVEFLHGAAANNRGDIVKDLIHRTHINPNLCDKKGWTALMRAAKVGAADAVRSLLAGHADLNAASKNKNGPLHKAAKAGHSTVVSMLAEVGAKLDAVNAGGGTPLMIAVMYNREEVVHCLLRFRAQVNIQKKDTGYSALMLAARQGREKLCTHLVEARAQLELQDAQRETALGKAQKKRKDAAASCLLALGADAQRGFKPPSRAQVDRQRTANAEKKQGQEQGESLTRARTGQRTPK